MGVARLQENTPDLNSCSPSAILIVNFAISDGRSNWMEGFLLIMCYVLIALLMWYYDPSSDIFV